MKRQDLTGFVAICQCGETIGALDYDRMKLKESGKIIGKWLTKGCWVEPKFGGAWSVNITGCKCE